MVGENFKPEKMKNVIYLIIVLLSVSCTEQREKKTTDPNLGKHSKDVHLVNTVWIYRISNECIDTLKFRPNQDVVSYDCELSYLFSGKYEITKDTLFVSLKDDSHSEDGSRITYFKDKYLVKENTLSFLGTLRLDTGKWKEQKVMRNTNIVYRKTE